MRTVAIVTGKHLFSSSCELEYFEIIRYLSHEEVIDINKTK